MKLLTLYQKLWELGHQEYSDEEIIYPLSCFSTNSKFDKMVNTCNNRYLH